MVNFVKNETPSIFLPAYPASEPWNPHKTRTIRNFSGIPAPDKYGWRIGNLLFLCGRTFVSRYLDRPFPRAFLTIPVKRFPTDHPLPLQSERTTFEGLTDGEIPSLICIPRAIFHGLYSSL